MQSIGKGFVHSKGMKREEPCPLSLKRCIKIFYAGIHGNHPFRRALLADPIPLV